MFSDTKCVVDIGKCVVDNWQMCSWLLWRKQLAVNHLRNNIQKWRWIVKKVNHSNQLPNLMIHWNMPSRCTFKYLLITEANVPYSYSDTFTYLFENYWILLSHFRLWWWRIKISCSLCLLSRCVSIPGARGGSTDRANKSCEECMKQDLNSLKLEGGRHGA